MTLRAGHYRAIQLFYDDGSPVLGPGNREVFVTRCGAELLGTRTDGGDATKNIATFLGIRRKTVAPSGPLTPVTVPGGVGTPGSGFEPGQGQIQGDGGGGLLTVGGGKLIVPEDKEVWVVKPCTRTPGPPPGPFPLGNHVATPLGVQHDDGSGAKAVYADGCVECARDWSCFRAFSAPDLLTVTFTEGTGTCACMNGFSRQYSRFGASNQWFDTNPVAESRCGRLYRPAPFVSGIGCPTQGTLFCLPQLGMTYAMAFFDFGVPTHIAEFDDTAAYTWTSSMDCLLHEGQLAFSWQPFFVQLRNLKWFCSTFGNSTVTLTITG